MFRNRVIRRLEDKIVEKEDKKERIRVREIVVRRKIRVN
jgi:hypothetical protein